MESSDGQFECKARGIFRKDGESPIVGDMVEFENVSDTERVISKVLPRKTLL